MYVKNIREIKINLRARYRQFRERLGEDQKIALDSTIQSRLLALREYAAADTIFTYVSKPIEVDTIALIKAALANHKLVAVPRCVPNTYDMQFYYITSLDDLEKGTFGVLEPVVSRCRSVTDFSRGFCIVPGLSFDAQGYRLGYGKGYYDRFLAEFGGDTVGICYSGCVQWNLPHGYYDRPVDILITEKYIRRVAKQAN
ncbi:5-formyltetrahydrofolate cyclo-ligase [Caproiciproducens sp.]|uniref:5-formyltetrahydrofolate cyclo-ligase n=1 Tax=Caproiciproducens sp. TaxID=1954376 RepID=UPI00289A7C22|nr:5-formyltetrahydrofolate cyclo-ligase [Caproiciproducens sp.]